MRMAARAPLHERDLLKLQDFQWEQYGFLVSRVSFSSARKNKCRFRKLAAHRVPDKRACNRSASRCTRPSTIRTGVGKKREREGERGGMRVYVCEIEKEIESEEEEMCASMCNLSAI